MHVYHKKSTIHTTHPPQPPIPIPLAYIYIDIIDMQHLTYTQTCNNAIKSNIDRL